MAVANALLSSFCIVADDLSGAADCAAAFASVAGPVPVVLDGGVDAAACLAIDTDSRARTEIDAVGLVHDIFAQLGAARSHQLVYKKIDSTLRGHVGPELAAALRAAPSLRAAVVAPAFPAQGRTLHRGKLLVHGAAPQQPGPSGDLPALLGAAGLQTAHLAPSGDDPDALAARIEAALEGGARAIVLDASTDRELATIAAAWRRLAAPVLVAGSAGLAHALAPHVKRGASPLAAGASLAGGPVLAVVGSFSPSAAAQVRHLEEAGVAHVIRLTASQWLEGEHGPLRDRVAEDARRSLAQGRHVVLAIDAQEPVAGASRALVHAMAPVAAGLLGLVRACVLTGGDTARAFLGACHVARLEVTGEAEPGISLARAPERPGIQFVLKAGGFGDAGTLVRIVSRFGPATT